MLKQNKSLVSKTNLKAKSKLKNKSKKHTIGWYKQEAKTWFNKAVKYRDSQLIDGAWIFPCITCPRRVLFKDADGRFYRNAHAGHFQPETYSNTRFTDENVNGQCGMPCNFNQGEQVKYARALDLKYGDGTALRLEQEAKIPKQWTIPELEAIIKEAKDTCLWYEKSMMSQ